MQKTVSLALTVLMAMQSAPAAFGGDSAANQISAIPAGAKIELHLKDKHTVRGTRGALSNTGFTLIDARSGDRQIAFDDVASAKLVKSHLTRNILIVVAIGVATLGIIIGVALRCGPFGCGQVRI